MCFIECSAVHKENLIHFVSITGFLGKAFTRHINRFWNYVIKGGIGSFLLVTFFPLICILVCTLCLLAAITTPVWMPLVTLFVHIFFIFVFDFDHPRKNIMIPTAVVLTCCRLFHGQNSFHIYYKTFFS